MFEFCDNFKHYRFAGGLGLKFTCGVCTILAWRALGPCRSKEDRTCVGCRAACKCIVSVTIYGPHGTKKC